MILEPELEKILASPSFKDGGALIDAALLKVTVDGMYLEFSISSGRTINIIVPNLDDTNFYGFDSFRPSPKEWRTRRGRKTAFLHIDCGLYAEGKKVFDLLKNSIVPGTILVCDEYFNYPGWDCEESYAWREFCMKQGLSYLYVGHTPTRHQVAIRVEPRGCCGRFTPPRRC